MNNVLEAFLFTLLAGMSTGIGGAFVFFAKTIDRRVLAVSLGLSAGGFYVPWWSAARPADDCAGARRQVRLLYSLIAFWRHPFDRHHKLIPCEENPHEMVCPSLPSPLRDALKAHGHLTAMAIAIHNFPRHGRLYQPQSLQLPIVAAIAPQHPRGISISMPIFYATGSDGYALFHPGWLVRAIGADRA